MRMEAPKWQNTAKPESIKHALRPIITCLKKSKETCSIKGVFSREIRVVYNFHENTNKQNTTRGGTLKESETRKVTPFFLKIEADSSLRSQT